MSANPYRQLVAEEFPDPVPADFRGQNLLGKRFSSWVVIGFSGKAKNGHTLWNCICDCGTRRIVDGGNLKSACSISCGCYQATQGGLTQKHPLAKTWCNLVQRCGNPGHPDFKHYGGRGIIMPESWAKFENFLADMGASHSPGMTLERIDNNASYSKGNCRWATRREQALNRRTNRPITINGETRLLGEWSAITGLRRETISCRIAAGTDPIRPRGPTSKRYG